MTRRRIRLVGSVYNDGTINQLQRLRGMSVIDIRKTAISQDGANALRQLLPKTTIIDGTSAFPG